MNYAVSNRLSSETEMRPFIKPILAITVSHGPSIRGKPEGVQFIRSDNGGVK